MKIEVNLEKLETEAVENLIEYREMDDKVSLGMAKAYTKLLADWTGRHYWELMEKVSRLADEKTNV